LIWLIDNMIIQGVLRKISLTYKNNWKGTLCIYDDSPVQYSVQSVLKRLDQRLIDWSIDWIEDSDDKINKESFATLNIQVGSLCLMLSSVS